MSPLEEFMGAFLIQVFLGLMFATIYLLSVYSLTCSICRLHGINLAQTYLYWLNRKRDPIILQCTVLVVALLEAIHSIFTMHMTYYYLIAAACGAGPLTIVWLSDFSGFPLTITHFSGQ